jgi:flagellar biosynthetic protein FlhB
MIAVVATIMSIAQQGIRHWALYFRYMLDAASTNEGDANSPILFWTSVEALRWIAPTLITALVVSLCVGFAQGGFVFAPEALALKFERVSPVSRLKQMFSLSALGNSLKSLLPFAAIAWIAYACLHSHWGAILTCSSIGPNGFANLLSTMLWELCWKSSLIFLAWSGVDYLLLWFKSESDLKMSRQEIREEMKQSDGNPATRARIRKLQRQSRRRQMIKAAEKATVVITNPTHYAVALRYEMEMAAPIVVAKGLDLLAQRLKDIARDHDIPIMENRPLAQALYKGAEVGDAIPSALYHAVAEILVLVYKAQAEVRKRDAERRASANARAASRPV